MQRATTDKLSSPTTPNLLMASGCNGDPGLRALHLAEEACATAPEKWNLLLAVARAPMDPTSNMTQLAILTHARVSGLHGELGQTAQQTLRAPARDAESAAVYLMEATRRRRSAASLRTNVFHHLSFNPVTVRRNARTSILDRHVIRRTTATQHVAALQDSTCLVAQHAFLLRSASVASAMALTFLLVIHREITARCALALKALGLATRLLDVQHLFQQQNLLVRGIAGALGHLATNNVDTVDQNLVHAPCKPKSTVYTTMTLRRRALIVLTSRALCARSTAQCTKLVRTFHQTISARAASALL